MCVCVCVRACVLGAIPLTCQNADASTLANSYVACSWGSWNRYLVLCALLQASPMKLEYSVVWDNYLTQEVVDEMVRCQLAILWCLWSRT